MKNLDTEDGMNFIVIRTRCSVAQPCSALRDPVDGGAPGSPGVCPGDKAHHMEHSVLSHRSSVGSHVLKIMKALHLEFAQILS